MTRKKPAVRRRRTEPPRSPFWTEARLQYWRDFDYGMNRWGGEIAGYIYAAEQKKKRELKLQAAKTKRNKPLVGSQRHKGK